MASGKEPPTTHHIGCTQGRQTSPEGLTITVESRRAKAHTAENHTDGTTRFGAARVMEPALLASEARMAKRSQLRVSEGLEGRSERPALVARATPSYANAATTKSPTAFVPYPILPAAWLFIFVPVTWATARSMRAAAAGWPVCSRSMAIALIAAIGLI